MTVKATYLTDISAVVLSEGEKPSCWVHALAPGSYKHHVYGTVDVPSERMSNFAESVKSKVRGIDPSVNYVHDGDGEAGGWIKDAEARSDGLWLFVEWTSDAARKLRDKAFKYFSLEFYDEWINEHGKKFKDVVFGGALTNRPYMKNLVPINLSEATYDNAFELVSIVTGQDVDSLKGGKGDMPMSEEELDKIVTKLAEKLAPKKDDPPKVDPPLPKLSDIPELKALAEENPMVKALITHVEAQNANLARSAQEIKEADIARRLAEFDRSKIVLTPVAKEGVVNILNKMPTELSEDFWKLLEEMKKSSAFLVELGERAGTTVNYGSPKSAAKQFNEAAQRYVTDEKLSYTDAVERVAAENPALYKRYRAEQFEGVNS